MKGIPFEVPDGRYTVLCPNPNCVYVVQVSSRFLTGDDGIRCPMCQRTFRAKDLMNGGSGGNGDAPRSACYAPELKGNWIQTFTGRQFFPFDPGRSDVAIEDIAHALSLNCRFTGHTRVHYSVAQHSVLVSQLVPTEHALCGLMHDASEAYLCDVPSPIKPGLRDYGPMEEAIMAHLAARFKFDWPPPIPVKEADMVAVATEARDLMANPPTMWKLPRAPLAGLRVDPWTPAEAEAQFLARFRELTK